MKNYSRQREAIIKILRENPCHPSAQFIYDEVRKIIPNISLGTVYRNLSNLKDDGEILAFKTNNGSEHFDGNANNHSHFCCNKCHMVFDLFNLDLPTIQSEVNRELIGFTLDNSLFYGVCKNCVL